MCYVSRKLCIITVSILTICKKISNTDESNWTIPLGRSDSILEHFTVISCMSKISNFNNINSLMKQTPSSYLKSNPKIQCSDNSFKVKPTKMLSVCGGRGLRPDSPSPMGVNLLLFFDNSSHNTK